MLAVVKSEPKVGIAVHQVPEPELKENHVIVEVKACGICGSDLHIYEWKPLIQWVSLPRILGHEVTGTLAQISEGVKGFEVGDRVVADTWGGCGECYFCKVGKFNHCLNQRRLGQHVDGGMAKYVRVPANSLYRIPESVGFEEASVIEPLGVMLRAFERCDFKPGDNIAFIGPGPIGLIGVMLAKASGASLVFAVGLKEDEARLALAAEFGAVPLIVNDEKPKEKIMDRTDGLGVDVVMDVSGGQDSLTMAADMVKRGGQIGLLGLSPPSNFAPMTVVEKELTIHGSFRRQPSTWLRAIELVKSRVIDLKRIITHTFPLEQAEEGFQVLLKKKGIKAILNP